MRSYRTFSPLPLRLLAERRFVLCGAIPEVALAGRYPAPCVYGARTFLHRGLSAFAAAAVQPTDEAVMGTFERPVKMPLGSEPIQPQAASAVGIERCASNCFNVSRVERSAMPSISAGR